ncbi:MAG: flagellar motor protein MotB [Parvularculaceae bacterium]|nr:flagellar motor protein MotB [Parvularculaceae bacterium]
MTAPLRQLRRGKRISGSWLITYADLMTLLVCFFVLIVSFSIQDQAKMEVVAGSIRDAFGTAEERRYAGDVKLKGVPDERQPGNLIETREPSGAGLSDKLAATPAAGSTGRNADADRADAARRPYIAARKKLEQAILMNPITKDANDAVTINLTEAGLQVMLVDTNGRAMFATGAAEPTPEARALLVEIAKALKPLANRITIDAHADASGAGRYSPFDLTANRANAARRVLEGAGFPTDRIAAVSAHGDADPLYPEDPFAAGNRRIEITLEAAAPLLPADAPL